MAIRLSDDILEFVGRPNTYGFLSAVRAFAALLESNAIDKNDNGLYKWFEEKIAVDSTELRFTKKVHYDAFRI